MQLLVAVLFGLFLNGLVCLEGSLAWQNKIFSPRQMQKNGHPYGLPWIAHGGASWGDFFILTPIVIAMKYSCGNQWAGDKQYLSALIAIIATGIFHWRWSRNRMPDCLAWGGRLTPAGWVHSFYMAITLTIVVLFYFHTVHIDPTFLVIVSVFIGLHIAIGNHMVLSLCAPKWWPINTLRDPGALTVTIGVWVALFFRCRYILAHQ